MNITPTNGSPSSLKGWVRTWVFLQFWIYLPRLQSTWCRSSSRFVYSCPPRTKHISLLPTHTFSGMLGSIPLTYPNRISNLVLGLHIGFVVWLDKRHFHMWLPRLQLAVGAPWILWITRIWNTQDNTVPVNGCAPFGDSSSFFFLFFRLTHL